MHNNDPALHLLCISDSERDKNQETSYLPGTEEKEAQLSAHCPFKYYTPNCNDPLPILEFTMYLSINGCGDGNLIYLRGDAT